MDARAGFSWHRIELWRVPGQEVELNAPGGSGLDTNVEK
jgi:hypothetical protein